MHMRKKKWARPELAACPYYAADPAANRGAWRSLFPAAQPLHLELGCGKGVSTSQMAYENQQTNYVAVDISADVLGVARRNLEELYGSQTPQNIILTRFDIVNICDMFAPEDRVERIYISFCNPWTARVRHHKHRLTHPRQLMHYRTFLTEDAEIWFKTDDDPLYRDSLKYFEACGFEAVYLTEDLHASGFAPNYVSEHEKKYTAQGVPIRFGIFRRRPGEVTADPQLLREWELLSGETEEQPTPQ